MSAPAVPTALDAPRAEVRQGLAKVVQSLPGVFWAEVTGGVARQSGSQPLNGWVDAQVGWKPFASTSVFGFGRADTTGALAAGGGVRVELP